MGCGGVDGVEEAGRSVGSESAFVVAHTGFELDSHMDLVSLLPRYYSDTLRVDII